MTSSCPSSSSETKDDASISYTEAVANINGQKAVIDLADAIIDNWLDIEKLVGNITTNRNGQIYFVDFFDCMHDLGLSCKANLKEAFEFVGNDTSLPIEPSLLISALYDASHETLKLDVEDAKLVSQTPVTKYPKLIALVAHNNMKPSMMSFVSRHINFFVKCRLVTTGSTGRSLNTLGLEVDHLVSSGPLGGDQEIGGLISKKEVAGVFFFTDPLSAHPHAADIEALIRICAVHDVITANNPSTGNALVYALKHSTFGMSRLMGTDEAMSRDTTIVTAYKENQKNVISRVTHSNKPDAAESLDDITEVKKPAKRLSKAVADKVSRASLDEYRMAKRQSTNIFVSQHASQEPDLRDSAYDTMATTKDPIVSFAESVYGGLIDESDDDE